MKPRLHLFAAILLAVVVTGCRSELSLPPTGPRSAATTCRSCSYYNDLSPTSYYLYDPALEGREWVVRDLDGWTSFYAVIDPSALVTPDPPVDLSALMLVARVIKVTSYMSMVPRDLCIGPGGVKVTYEINEICNALRGMSYESYRAYLFAVPPSDLPVTWEETYVPRDGPPCPTPVPIYW